MTMSVIWKDIPNYEGIYQVSDFGCIKSLDRTILTIDGVSVSKKGKLIKPCRAGGGYLAVCLSLKNKSKTITVHKLVAMSFLGYKPDGTCRIVADHVDGNIYNNNLSNLQLISHRQNMSKAIRPNKKRKCIGVVKLKESSYTSIIQYEGNKINLGVFKTEEEASEYYQNALNAIENGEEIVVKRAIFTSKYKGVFFCKRTGKFGASITENGKTKIIGSFMTEQQAFEARENYIKNKI